MRLLLLLIAAMWLTAALAQDPGAMVHPAPDLAAGQALFERSCGACHGANARGGRNGAPDLLASDVAMGDLARFAAFVRAGAPTAGMPGFPLDDASLGLIHGYLRVLRRQEPARGRKTFELVGDAARGRIFFDSHCARCHSLQGDLRHIGSRYPPRVLQGRIVMPRGSGVHPGLLALGVHIPGVTDQVPVDDQPRRVTVRTADGRTFEGTLVAISDFLVALRDANGRYRSFTRRGDAPAVTVHDPAQSHIDLLGKIADSDLHDLTAFLASQK